MWRLAAVYVLLWCVVLWWVLLGCVLLWCDVVMCYAVLYGRRNLTKNPSLKLSGKIEAINPRTRTGPTQAVPSCESPTSPNVKAGALHANLGSLTSYI